MNPKEKEIFANFVGAAVQKRRPIDRYNPPKVGDDDDGPADADDESDDLPEYGGVFDCLGAAMESERDSAVERANLRAARVALDRHLRASRHDGGGVDGTDLPAVFNGGPARVFFGIGSVAARK